MRHERSGNVWYEHYAKVKEMGDIMDIVVDLDNMVPVDFTPVNWFHGYESITGYGEYGALNIPESLNRSFLSQADQ